jgi:hypothetical protein
MAMGSSMQEVKECSQCGSSGEFFIVLFESQLACVGWHGGP